MALGTHCSSQCREICAHLCTKATPIHPQCASPSAPSSGKLSLNAPWQPGFFFQNTYQTTTLVKAFSFSFLPVPLSSSFSSSSPSPFPLLFLSSFFLSLSLSSLMHLSVYPSIYLKFPCHFIEKKLHIQKRKRLHSTKALSPPCTLAPELYP